MRAQRGREREAGQVDEPVRGRHEQRQVVQAVVVDAPDQRAGDLADRREADDAERLSPHLERHARERREQNDDRQPPSAKLLGIARVPIKR